MVGRQVRWVGRMVCLSARRVRVSSGTTVISCPHWEGGNVKQTPFTALVGCSVPIQLAGMGGVSTPKLVAADSNACALGMLNLSGVGSGDIAKVIDDLAERTTRPVGANFLMPFLDMSAVELAAEPRPQPCVTRRQHEVRCSQFIQPGSERGTGSGDARSLLRARCRSVALQARRRGHRSEFPAVRVSASQVVDGVTATAEQLRSVNDDQTSTRLSRTPPTGVRRQLRVEVGCPPPLPDDGVQQFDRRGGALRPNSRTRRHVGGGPSRSEVALAFVISRRCPGRSPGPSP